MLRRFSCSYLWVALPFFSLVASVAAGDYSITIGVVPGQLRYDVIEFEVSASSSLEVTFDNNGLMPHNLLFTQSGTALEVVRR